MFFAYLLASQPYGTLYIGSTSDLVRRVWEHKVKPFPGLPQSTALIDWSGSSVTTHWKRRYSGKSASRVGSELGKSSSSKRTIRIGSIYTRSYGGEDRRLVRAAGGGPAFAERGPMEGGKRS